MFNNGFFPKIVTFLDNVEKYCRAEQATNDTTAHAHFTLDKQSIQTNTEICNTHFFSTATVVARTSLNVTLHN